MTHRIGILGVRNILRSKIEPHIVDIFYETSYKRYDNHSMSKKPLTSTEYNTELTCPDSTNFRCLFMKSMREVFRAQVYLPNA